MPLQLNGNCHYHPSRRGIGVCVECKQVICNECSTQVDGINRCAACLTAMSRVATGPRRGSDYRFGSIFTMLLIFSSLFGGISIIASAISDGLAK